MTKKGWQSMWRLMGVTVITLAAAGSLLVSACGGKKEGDKGTGGAQAAAGNATGVTATEVTIGQAAAFTGPSQRLGVEFWRGVTAAIMEANERGGIQGRKIKLVTSDDAYDAEKALPAVQKLVEQDKVFCLFGGVGTPTIAKVLPYVTGKFESEKLFYFSNFTGAQVQREPPHEKAVFNVRASYRDETKALVDAFVAAGKKKIGLWVQDDGYGQSGRDGVLRALKEHNLIATADTRYPRGQKFEDSNDASVKALMGSSQGTEAIIAVASYQAAAGFVRDARKAGFKGPIGNVSFVGPDQMLSLVKGAGGVPLDNLITSQVVPSYNDQGVLAVREYRAAMDKFKPMPTFVSGYDLGGNPYSFGSLEGYISGRAFVTILNKAGKELTRESFLAAAEQMGQFDLGLGAMAEFSATRHQALNYVWLTYAAAEGWMPVDPRASVIK